MSKASPFAVILTCEHGGNQIPPKHECLFVSPAARQALRSHRGYDPGAFDLAESLASRLNVELHASRISRLLIELNRSENATDLFSKYTCGLSAAVKRAIVAELYSPFRKQVSSSIGKLLRRHKSVVHLSIHTFTPCFRGTRRDFDIGVLFDPSRTLEARLSRSLLQGFTAAGFEARGNQPYLGTDDGHTTELRKRFSAEQYVGIELEVNNRFAKFSDRTKTKWAQQIADTVTRVVR